MENNIRIGGDEKSGFCIYIDSYVIGSRRNARTWKTKEGAEKFIAKIKEGTATYKTF